MRKSTLYAGRFKGDIAPGLEPTRLGGDGAKAWARMDFPGRIIPGQEDHNIYTKSATPKFEVGTRRVEYGRTFRYAKAGRDVDTLAVTMKLLGNANYVPDAVSHEDEDGFYGNPKTQVEIGDLYIDLDTATAYAANFFQGGYVVSYVSPYHVHYIVKSDLGNGTYCRIYLDHAQTTVIPTGGGLEIHGSPYNNVIDWYPSAGYATFMSAVGVMHCAALDSGDFFWLQTAGPAFVQPTDWAAQCPGYASEKRDVYCNCSDGTACLQVTTGSRQRIGYLLPATENGYGSALIMLQLE